MGRRILGAVISTLFVVLLLAMPSTPARPRALTSAPIEELISDDDVLVLRLASDPGPVDPARSYSPGWTSILDYVNARLFVIDPARCELVPELCADMPSWSLDRRVLRLRLRSGARWHDGVRVSARDVALSCELQAKAGDAPQTYDRCEVVDDVTVDVVFKKPDYYHMFFLAGLPLVAAHAARNRPVHCGPWRIESYWPGDRAVLMRNEQWPGQRSSFRRIILRIIPEQDKAIAALKRGEIDLLEMTPSVWQKELATGPPANFRVMWCASTTYYFVGWNLDRAFFKDRRVRRALAHLVDVPHLIQNVFAGHAVAASGPFTVRDPAVDAGIQPVAFDPTVARAFFADAGWNDSDGDGLLDRDGQPLAIEVLCPTSGTRNTLAREMEGGLVRGGIAVRRREVEWAVFLERIAERQFDAIVFGWSQPWPEEDLRTTWHSAATAKTGFNYSGFVSAQADQVLDSMPIEFNPSRRLALGRAFHRIVAKEQPCAFLMCPESAVIYHSRLRNMRWDLHRLGAPPRPGTELWVRRGEELRGVDPAGVPRDP